MSVDTRVSEPALAGTTVPLPGEVKTVARHLGATATALMPDLFQSGDTAVSADVFLVDRHGMTRRFVAVAVLLALAAPCWGQKLTLPKEVTGDVGAFLKVSADTDGAQVRWVALDTGLNVFPSELLKDSRSTVVTASKPGRYRLLAYTAKGDVPSDPATCVVVVGGATPTPPDPTPPDPTPVDPLTKALQKVYDDTQEASKQKSLADVTAFYSTAAEVCNDASIGTWGDLFSRLNQAQQNLGLTGKLVELRKLCLEEWKQKMPSEAQRPFDSAGRALAAAEFKRVAKALRGVKS